MLAFAATHVRRRCTVKNATLAQGKTRIPKARLIPFWAPSSLATRKKPKIGERAELTSQQAQIVNTLKRQCPGFAVMRKLVFSFRAILRRGKVTTIYRWMEEAHKTGLHSLVRFVRTSKQDISARASALINPTVTDYYERGGRRWLQSQEKRGESTRDTDT